MSGWRGISGNVIIRNCIVSGFNSWYLGDLTTTSSLATTRTKTVLIERNYFKENSGSFAVRGKIDQPTEKVSFLYNKFTVAAQHASFWDAFEASGGVKHVVCRGNDIELETVTGTKVGGFQIWSKSALPWILEYEQNTMKKMRVGLKLGAHLSGFYAPNTADSRFKIDLNSPHTEVEFAYSPVYKHPTTPSVDKWTQGPYQPSNSGVYQVPPVAFNPLGYAIVSPS